MDDASDSRPLVQSVDRACEVMEILGRKGWTGVTELGRAMQIHKSTVFRLLSTLERRGMVERDPASQKYRLGFGLVRLAGAVRSTVDLTMLSRPLCERLSKAANEAVNIAILEGDEVVNIDQANLSSSMVAINWVGRHTTLHSTSTGKMLLAHLPERAREEILRRPLHRFTAQTITDPVLLAEQLELIRRTGHAVALEELEEGLHAVAAPVRGADGSVVAAVSVSGPAYRLTLERIETEVAEITVRTAGEISRRLGGPRE